MPSTWKSQAGTRWLSTRNGRLVLDFKSHGGVAELAYAGDLKSLAARIVGSSPTAPTIYCLRARVPLGCGLVSFGRRWDSNPRGGERQADAQRPQRAGEGAGRRPKPVRICEANTRTSHRPYHLPLTSLCPPGMRTRFFWTPSTAEQLIWDRAFLTTFKGHSGRGSSRWWELRRRELR